MTRARSGRKLTSESLAAEVADLRQTVRQLARLCSLSPTQHPAGQPLVVAGELGIVEVGDLGDGTFGVRVSGRGKNFGASTVTCVYNEPHGGESTEVGARVHVSGIATSIRLEAPLGRSEAPSVVLDLDALGGAELVRLGGRFLGHDDRVEPIDTEGGWCGEIQLSDGPDMPPVTIDRDGLRGL